MMSDHNILESSGFGSMPVILNRENCVIRQAWYLRFSPIAHRSKGKCELNVWMY